MIYHNLSDINCAQSFLKINDVIEASLYFKIEGLNPASSIKIKTAKYLLDDLEKKFNHQLYNYKIIESSSGNLGIALSILSKERGYNFTCVVDPNTSKQSIQLIKLHGGNIISVDTPDANGGFLKSRIEFIKDRINSDSRYIWINQYNNQNNISAHYNTTAPELYSEFGSDINYLFIGTGTTGTLGGCAKFFKEKSPRTKIIAVEPIGSVTFGGSAGKRYLPGIGTSCKPEIASLLNVDKVVYVNEQETVMSCYELLHKECFLSGPSTGSVLAAIKRYENYFSSNDLVVGISPDMGGKYLDTLYDENWLNKHNLQIRDTLKCPT